MSEFPPPPIFRSLEKLSLWLSDNPTHPQNCLGQREHCLWDRAIHLVLRHSHDTLNWDDGKTTIDDMDRLFLSTLLDLVQQGLRIDKSYHYRTSFLYEVFVVLANTKPIEENKNLLLELYDKYVQQHKGTSIRVFGGLEDILSLENYNRWRAKKMKDAILEAIPECLPPCALPKKM